jgi:hypothetical protein
MLFTHLSHGLCWTDGGCLLAQTRCTVIPPQHLQKGAHCFIKWSHSMQAQPESYCTGRTLWHLQKCIQYILFKFTPSIILLYLPILRIPSTGLIFHFHIWVHNIPTIFTFFHPFLISSPLPLLPTPRQNFYYLPVLHYPLAFLRKMPEAGTQRRGNQKRHEKRDLGTKLVSYGPHLGVVPDEDRHPQPFGHSKQTQ